MYRTIATTVTLILIFIFSSHGQANASIAETPHAISAKSILGNQIIVSFDQQLSSSDLFSGKFHISTPNVYVYEASVQGDKVIILLSKSIQEENNVLLTIDSGAVTTYESESANEAVSNLRVITPASTISLKNTLDPNKTGLSVQHIVTYMATANPQNVYGTTAFNHEDISYLLSLVEGVNVNKSMLNNYYLESSYILSNTSNYPLPARNTLSNAISAAQAVLNQSNSKQRQVDEAVIALMKAQNVYVSMGYPFLKTDQTDPDFEIIGNMIYVPSGMSVPTLINKLTPAVEIHAAADNSTLVTSGNVTRGMKVVISNSPSQIYHLKIQASVSNTEQLYTALADNSVSIINLKANITSTEDIHINHNIHFKALQPYTIAVRNIKSNSSYSWDGNVRFLKNVHNEAELLAALNTSGDIEVKGEGIDGFTGLLVRMNSGIISYYRSADHSRAFVSYVDGLQGALLDAEVTNIYIAQDIYVNDTLTFPERTIVLSGPTSPKSTIRANSITNTLTGNSEAIHIVNATAPYVTYMSWGNGEAGALNYRGSDQALTLGFNSDLDTTARQRVEQALLAGARDKEGLSVTEATYLDFDWSSESVNFRLDVRNNIVDPIYFPEDIYAELSNLPYSKSRILDPTPFKAYMYRGDDAIVVVFNQPLASATLLLKNEQIIQSLKYTPYFVYENAQPINYTSTVWDITDADQPRLLIHFEGENVPYNDQIHLILNPGSIRSVENEVVNHALSTMPG